MTRNELWSGMLHATETTNDKSIGSNINYTWVMGISDMDYTVEIAFWYFNIAIRHPVHGVNGR